MAVYGCPIFIGGGRNGFLNGIVNVGDGADLFAGRDGNNAQLRSIVAGEGIEVEQSATEIEISRGIGTFAQAGTSTNQTLTQTDYTLLSSTAMADLPEGTYFVAFNMDLTLDTGTQTVEFALFVNGVIGSAITHRTVNDPGTGMVGVTQNTGFSIILPLAEGDDLEVRARTTAGDTVTIKERHISAVKL